jgi:hypothetical protein
MHSNSEATLPLMDSNREQGSLVVQFIAQDIAEAAADALIGAETALEAGGVTVIANLAESQSIATGDAVVALGSIVSKLDVFIQIVDKTAKVRMSSLWLKKFLFSFIAGSPIR